MTDAFLSARPEYRRALSLASKPLPILAGEVAEYPRPASFAMSVVRCLPATAVFIVCVSGVCALIVGVFG